MIKTVDFDGWDKYKGLSEGSGRSEKIWLQSSGGAIGVFKFPKTDDYGNVSSTEYVSEHLASRLGKVIGVPVADVDIGFRDGRIGCMSYLINSEIVEGIHFISRLYPQYNSKSLKVPGESLYYCLNMIKEATNGVLPPNWYVQMMIFDYLIGNSDRHQSNWAVIKVNDGSHQLCPLYDNGSSLCSFVGEKDIESLKFDTMRFEALVVTKSRSCIRIDGYDKRKPRHEDVVKWLITDNDEAYLFAKGVIDLLDERTISKLLSEYPSNILSTDKKSLIERFLFEKIRRLNCILKGKNDD